MATTLTSYEGALNDYAQKRKSILDNNRLADDGSPIKVMQASTMTEIRICRYIWMLSSFSREALPALWRPVLALSSQPKS